MKLVSSTETFEFQHDGETLISLSPVPVAVSDEAATHLTNTYGSLVRVEDVELSSTETEEGEVEVEAEVAEAPIESVESADQSEEGEAETQVESTEDVETPGAEQTEVQSTETEGEASTETEEGNVEAAGAELASEDLE